MASKFREWWQKVKQHWATIGVVGIGFVVVIALIVFGYRLDWTGFNGNNKSGKTLWDWLQLLIVPVVLAVAALLFNLATSKREQQIALDNQRETLLQDYLDRMSELLLDKNLKDENSSKEVRDIARARTLTTLSRLDPVRKGYLVQFLQEAGLINRYKGIREDDKTIISMANANLSEAYLVKSILLNIDLSHANLSKANLSEASMQKTSLSEADLTQAHLVDAFVTYADLTGADLRAANLTGINLYRSNLGIPLLGEMGANLTGADLTRANLNETDLTTALFIDANLTEAKLEFADLSRADFTRANLTGASLKNANITEANFIGANISEEQLEEARSLQGPIRPDGSIHP